MRKLEIFLAIFFASSIVSPCVKLQKMSFRFGKPRRQRYNLLSLRVEQLFHVYLKTFRYCKSLILLKATITRFSSSVVLTKFEFRDAFPNFVFGRRH